MAFHNDFDALLDSFALLCGDLRILDDFGPPRTILGDQVGQALRRAALRDQALLAE
jgi:hypothetical protein